MYINERRTEYSPEEDPLAEALNAACAEPLALEDDVLAAHAVEPERGSVLHGRVAVGRRAQGAPAAAPAARSATGAALRRTHRQPEHRRHSLPEGCNGKSRFSRKHFEITTGWDGAPFDHPHCDEKMRTRCKISINSTMQSSSHRL